MCGEAIVGHAHKVGLSLIGTARFRVEQHQIPSGLRGQMNGVNFGAPLQLGFLSATLTMADHLFQKCEAPVRMA